MFVFILNALQSKFTQLKTEIYNCVIEFLTLQMQLGKLANAKVSMTVLSKIINNLIHTLEKESVTAVEWFNQNKRIVKPDKFQAICC